MVLAHCQPSNWRALFWMSAYYRVVEKKHGEMLNMARILMREHEVHLKKKRIAPAKDAIAAKGEKTRRLIEDLAKPLLGLKSRHSAAEEIAKKTRKSKSHVLLVLEELYPNGRDSWPLPKGKLKNT